VRANKSAERFGLVALFAIVTPVALTLTLEKFGIVVKLEIRVPVVLIGHDISKLLSSKTWQVSTALCAMGATANTTAEIPAASSPFEGGIFPLLAVRLNL
jgi:hypothetical protein